MARKPSAMAALEGRSGRGWIGVCDLCENRSERVKNAGRGGGGEWKGGKSKRCFMCIHTG